VSGIYIHIPFCKQACHYCDFHFSTSLQNKDKLVSALCREIELRKDYLEKKEINTLYFGGGTPSLLDFKEIEKIIQEVSRHFTIATDAEITLEANPDDLSVAQLKELKAIGINRLSIGIQSFFDEDLALMNRSHNAEQATNAVQNARKAGFRNISIDLIYGLPNLSKDRWQENLSTAFALEIEHLSAYNLTVERKTALAHFVKEKKIILPPEQAVIEQFHTLIEQAQKHGFIHYEISNFCKEGMYSKHNTNYWKSEHYLGIGPSAHSYSGLSRQWNVANNNSYINNIGTQQSWYEQEVLSDEDKFNEYVMTRLRTIWGIDVEFVKTTFGSDKADTLVNHSRTYIASGDIQNSKENIILTPKGKLLADKIASDFFI